MEADRVVSLGEGGTITLRFEPPISDGDGDDFAVFENSVVEGFLELAEREPDRVRVIDADGPPEKVFARIHPILPEALR